MNMWSTMRLSHFLPERFLWPASFSLLVMVKAPSRPNAYILNIFFTRSASPSLIDRPFSGSSL